MGTERRDASNVLVDGVMTILATRRLTPMTPPV